MKSLVGIITFLLVSIYAHAHPAYGIVVDKNRNIYFTDIHHNGMGSVWKLHNSGEIELLLKNFHAHNITLDKSRFIYTAHGEDVHCMIRISEQGVDTIYQTSDFNEFFGGNATYSKGRIIFSLNHFLWSIRAGEKDKLSDHYFEWNQSMYADENGIVYASDKATKGGSIVKIDMEGCSEIIATNIIKKLDRPIDKHNDVILGITQGCDETIYVAETAGRRIVKVIDEDSNETFYQPKNGWSPVGIDFFSDDAYIY